MQRCLPVLVKQVWVYFVGQKQLSESGCVVWVPVEVGEEDVQQVAVACRHDAAIGAPVNQFNGQAELVLVQTPQQGVYFDFF